MSKYNITKYSYDRAKELGVKIAPSTNKKKKIDVFDWNENYICSIGAKGYSDYPTFLSTCGRECAEEHRNLYWARHHKDINKLGTAGYYAGRILW
jgi:hypothetical protein